MIPIILIGAAYLIGKSMEGKTYVNGGKLLLLAPNGKPSKLTPEQWHLVRTPKFKAWFGDWENDADNASKVVDEETKEPLVCYHGTKNDFSIFKNDKLIWVTNEIEYIDKMKGLLGGDFVIELFVYSKKILDLTQYGYKYYDTKTAYNIFYKYGIELPEILTRPLGAIFYTYIQQYKDSIKKQMVKLDYDGIKVKVHRAFDFSFALINPNQVKLADGSNTTFDVSNPDIRYEVGGDLYNDKINNIESEDRISYTIDGVEVGNLSYIYDENGLSESLPNQSEFYIDYVFVKDEYRDRGIAQKLIKSALIEANKRNAKQITLKRDSGLGCNIGSDYDNYLKKLYSKFGFKDINDDDCGMVLFNNNLDIKYDEGGIVVGENDGNNKFPTKLEAFELIQDSIESQGSYFIDKNGDGMFANKKQALKYVDEIYNFFDYFYSMAMIPIYRGVKSDEVDLDPYSIGESWSLYLDNAKRFASHLGTSKELKIISAYVPKNNVDWESAFKLYPLFSDFGDSDSEFELPIPSNNKLINVKVSNYNDAKDLEPYKFKKGGRTIAQTPAPKADKIYGSKVNPKGSASSEKSASKIILSESIMDGLSNKLAEFKKENKNDNITLNDLKAVYRRGLGAYSSSHRPTISGGKPNSRNAWAMARVNKFLLKASGEKVKKAYVQDDDLLTN